VIDVVNTDEVKAFDYHTIDDEERCLVGIETVGASDVKFGVLTRTTSLVDDEARNTPLEGHGDVGVTRADEVFTRDATANLEALTFLHEAISPVDEFLIFLCLQLVAETYAEAPTAFDGDVVGAFLVIDVDGIGGCDIGEAKTALLVGAGYATFGNVNACALDGGAGDVGDDAVEGDALLLGDKGKGEEKGEENGEDAGHRGMRNGERAAKLGCSIDKREAAIDGC
jgi:hypothetical protein